MHLLSKFNSSSISTPLAKLMDLSTTPVIEGQDPWVIPYKKTYLLIQSNETANKINVTQYKDCQLKHAIKTVTIFEPNGGDHSKHLWAPELHCFQDINDKWYVYYAACDGKNKNHRMYVLESDTSDPMGAYHEIGKISDKSNNWAIDLTVLNNNNSLFAIWSGWEGKKGDFPQNIYIAPMNNPWTICGTRVCISKPELDWEKSVAAINEGPQVVIKNGKIHLVFSADASWSKCYKLGLLTFKGGNLLDPNAWVKDSKPVFEQGLTNLFGPGHASFVTVKNKDYIIYHHKISQDIGWERVIKVQQFGWTDNNVPYFGEPGLTRIKNNSLRRQLTKLVDVYK